jgi:hypothetical protein
MKRAMKKELRRSATVMTIAALLFGFMSAPAAQAETFAFSSSPLTNLNPAGATINGGFTKFPAGKGLYISQCTEPVTGGRPAICSDTVQVWVSDSGERGTVKSTSGITIKPTVAITGRGGSADCSKVTCGLFFQVDHVNNPSLSDKSEDKFLPISFVAGVATPTLSSDVFVVTADGQVLTKNVPSNISYRKSVKIVVTAQSGLTPEVTSSTTDCTFSAGVLTALKGSGICAIDVKTPGNATTAPTPANYPFFVGLGEQAIATIATSVKVGKRLTLPAETTFGEKIGYKTSSKNCQVSKGVLKGIKKGSCVVTATAAGKADMWKPLVRNISIPVK